MNTVQAVVANPFALMMDPESVLAAMARSERLAHLNRQVFRPLDKPLVAKVNAAAAAFDELVDGAADISED
jgi:hypothetical protein